MIETYGATAIPIVADAAGADPCLTNLAAYLQAVGNAYGAAAWQAIAPKTGGGALPIAHVITHDPERFDFTDAKTPLLAVFRSGVDRRVWAAQGDRVEYGKITVRWVPPSIGGQKIAALRSRFVDKLTRIFDAAIEAGRDPAWFLAGDHYYDASPTLAPVVAEGGASAITLTGTPTAGGLEFRLEIQTTGARGTATFRYSTNGGASWLASGLATAATVVLGATGVTAAFPVASYGAGMAWRAVTVALGSVLQRFAGYRDLKMGATAFRAMTIRKTDGSPPSVYDAWDTAFTVEEDLVPGTASYEDLLGLDGTIELVTPDEDPLLYGEFEVTAPVDLPLPVIDAVTPVVEGVDSTFTITGENFVPGAYATVNGYVVGTVFVSDTSLTGTVPSSLTTLSYLVRVTQPSGTSNAVTLAVTEHAPTVATLTPSTTPAGSSSTTLTVDGAFFNRDAVVFFNGTALVTTFVSRLQLTAVVPAGLLTTQGSATVAVTQGSGSASTSFAIAARPAPVISALSPVVEGTDATFTITGLWFTSGASVTVNGTSVGVTYNSATSLTANVPAVLTGGPYLVVVSQTSGSSSAVALSVTELAPSVSSLSPSSIVAGSSTTTVLVNGAAFNTDAAATFGGTAVTTTFVSPTQLSLAVPSGLLTTAGGRTVAVTQGSGTASTSFTVTAIPAPAITALGAVTEGVSTTFSVTGTGFQVGASVLVNGVAVATTTYNSPTSLTASVPPSLTGGPYPVTVTQSSGTSGAVNLSVTEAAPTLTSISPTSVTAGASDTTLTLTGTRFNIDAVAYAGSTSLATSGTSETSRTAVIPAALMASAGTLAITVVQASGTTAPQTFTVASALTTTTVSPTTATQFDGATTITVTGTGFSAGSIVKVDGVSMATTYGSPTSLTATVPAAGASSSPLNTSGAKSVTVLEGVTTSNAQTLTVSAWDETTPGNCTGLFVADAGNLTMVGGTTVSQWADTSGASRHFNQATGASQPTVSATDAAFGGKRVVVSDGVAQFLTRTGGMDAFITVSEAYVFACIKPMNGSTGYAAGTVWYRHTSLLYGGGYCSFGGFNASAGTVVNGAYDGSYETEEIASAQNVVQHLSFSHRGGKIYARNGLATESAGSTCGNLPSLASATPLLFQGSGFSSPQYLACKLRRLVTYSVTPPSADRDRLIRKSAYDTGVAA